jgi:hypothetical protein
VRERNDLDGEDRIKYLGEALEPTLRNLAGFSGTVSRSGFPDSIFCVLENLNLSPS